MKDMMRTVVFAIFFWIIMLLTQLFLIPYGLLRLIRADQLRERYLLHVAHIWGKLLFNAIGARITISGLENLPEHNRICFIGNHQSYADIPLIIGYLPKTIGFIAKKEIRRVPFVGIWAALFHSIFIDRGNMRSAMRGIEMGIKNIAQGHPAVIFPEGTRSRGPAMNRFKAGGIHMAAKEGLTIVPLTIDGTYKLIEEKNRVVPAPVKITIHPAVETAGLSGDQQKELPEQLWQTVAAALPGKGE